MALCKDSTSTRPRSWLTCLSFPAGSSGRGTGRLDGCIARSNCHVQFLQDSLQSKDPKAVSLLSMDMELILLLVLGCLFPCVLEYKNSSTCGREGMSPVSTLEPWALNLSRSLCWSCDSSFFFSSLLLFFLGRSRITVTLLPPPPLTPARPAPPPPPPPFSTGLSVICFFVSSTSSSTIRRERERLRKRRMNGPQVVPGLLS